MREDDFQIRPRIAVLSGLMLIGFLLLAVRLYFEQIDSSSASRSTITRQSIRRIRIPAQRGRIYSSDGLLLAGNESRLDFVFYPHEMRQSGRARTVKYILDAAEQAASRIGRPNPLTADKIREHLNRRPGLPLTVFENLSRAELARAVEFSGLQSGAAVESNWLRVYPNGSFAAHLIGYVRSDDSRRADDRENFFYYIPDQVGRSGMEKACDRLEERGNAPLRGLRGEPGYSLVRVDNLGFIRDVLIEEIEPKDGNHVILTLDSKAQRIAEALFPERSGGFVLLDADNGDVLAMASAPGYDLRRFYPTLSRSYYQTLNTDTRLPLFNRAVSGTYTPGSILKPLIALALLENGVDPTETTVCDGATKIGNSEIRCASHIYGGHGTVDLVRALEKSCNDYFVEHGVRVGLAALRDVLVRAGIGRSPLLELPCAAGVAPSPEYKLRSGAGAWTAHDTGMLSIGQGTVSVSPLQAALFCAALANGGTLYRPHLIRSVVDQRGIVLFSPERETAGKLDVSAEHLDAVRRGMFEVVNSPVGSGRRAKVEGLSIFGKTGTAEVGPRDNRHKNVWFIAFVSYRGRNYACSLLLENSGSGGSDCAPLIAEFFRKYLLDGGEGGEASAAAPSPAQRL